MRAVFYLLAVVSTTFAIPAKPDYFALESNPDYKRFIYVENENGEVQLLDLKQGNVTTRAEVADVTYYLYTLTNKDDPFVIVNGDVSQLASSPFDPSKPNVFVIHGWNNDHTSNVNTYVKTAVLENFDRNVFVVDWGGIANLNYLTAKAAVVPIGGFVAEFINNIQTTFGLTGASFCLIGHSLGAHVAGNAGAAVNDPVDHITGLDPAGPLFSMGDISNRIDPTDAKKVHIIHTNGLLLGFASPIGHADYYPNGGMTQPGCGLDLTGSCAHGRSYQYLAESFKGQSVFGSWFCDTFGDYLDGYCDNNSESYMGNLLIDQTATGNYYLVTNDEAPFAISSK